VVLGWWFKKNAQFYLDDQIIFNPFPLHHVTAILEWGMNWCVSTQIKTYLIIHAAVIEKDGYAAVLPAPPGSGKSTLCASLVQEGWRLLSDELTLINLTTAEAVPIPRPIGLKNQSIDIIKQRYPDTVFGILSSDTLKGSVCHLKPPAESIKLQFEECPIGWIIFPKYEAGADTELMTKSKGQAFMEIADNAFNYSVLGVEGFDILTKVIDRADCFSFKYSNLDEAIAVFEQLEAPREV
jgi:HprK-related kinase A